MPQASPNQILHVALQDGFLDDAVVVRVNGEEVHREKGVSSDPRIGLAASFDLEAPQGPATLEIELPGRKLRKTIEVDATTAPYVGVTHVEGGIEFRVSERPFGYL